MNLIDDSKARKQYYNMWWLTVPFFFVAALYEFELNSSISKSGFGSSATNERQEFLNYYAPFAVLMTVAYTRLSYSHYENQVKAEIDADETSEELYVLTNGSQMTLLKPQHKK